MIQKLTPNRPLLAGLANEQGTGGTLTVTDGVNTAPHRFSCSASTMRPASRPRRMLAPVR